MGGVAGLAALTELRQGFADPCDRESQYHCVRVVDASTEFPAGRARAMVLDHLLHSINHESWPEALAAPYVHLGPRARRAGYFFAGGGAYTQPRAIRSTRSPVPSAVHAAPCHPQYTQPRAIRSAMPEARVKVAEVAARRPWVSTEGMRTWPMAASIC